MPFICTPMGFFQTEFLTSSQIGPEEQKAVLQVTVLNEMCKKYPPSVGYQKAFMKNLLHKVLDYCLLLMGWVFGVYCHFQNFYVPCDYQTFLG